jgi:hypothetical protein
MRIAGPVALALVVGLALTACTGGARPAPHRTPTASASIQPPPTFTGLKRPLPSPEQLTNDPALYRDVTLTGCTRTKDGWRATGTAANAGSEKAGYRIIVFFTDAQARTLDYARTSVEVPAGKTTTWTATRPLHLNGVHCVIRAVH